MRTIKNPFAVNLVNNVIDRIPVKKTGIYNRMDPTKFEKGEIEINGHTITFNDVTWGIELEITNNVLVEYGLTTEKFNSKLYLDWEDQVICDHGIAPGTFKILHESLKLMKEVGYLTREQQIEQDDYDDSDFGGYAYI